jgi:hypothetical protein
MFIFEYVLCVKSLKNLKTLNPGLFKLERLVMKSSELASANEKLNDQIIIMSPA